LSSNYGTSKIRTNTYSGPLNIQEIQNSSNGFWIKLSKENEIFNNLDKTINKLAKHKYACQNILSKANPRLLTELWVKTLQIKNFSIKTKVQNRLQPYVKKICGRSLAKSFYLKVKFTSGCNLNNINRLCRQLVYKFPLTETTKNFVSANLRSIPLKGKAIRNFLVNSREKASEGTHKCLGSPFCNQDNHLSVPLSYFGWLKLNNDDVSLSYVPHTRVETNQESIITAIANWALHVKNLEKNIGLNRINLNNTNQLPIFDRGLLLCSLSLRRYQRLRWLYSKTTNNTSEKKFLKILLTTIHTYSDKLKNLSIIPCKIFNIISKHCKIDHERFSSPFSSKLDNFYSLLPSDSVFGARLQDEQLWEGTNLAYPGIHETNINNCLTLAITSALLTNATSLLLLPINTNTSSSYLDKITNDCVH
jgi:hypothetical protein